MNRSGLDARRNPSPPTELTSYVRLFGTFQHFAVFLTAIGTSELALYEKYVDTYYYITYS